MMHQIEMNTYDYALVNFSSLVDGRVFKEMMSLPPLLTPSFYPAKKAMGMWSALVFPAI